MSQNFQKFHYLLLACLAIGIPDSAQAGSVQFSTYYPAPFGMYDRLRLVPRADLGAQLPCDPGTMYINAAAGNQLEVCNAAGDFWAPLSGGPWTQDASGVTVIDTTANVGIGTTTPTSRLHVWAEQGDDPSPGVFFEDTDITVNGGADGVFGLRNSSATGTRKISIGGPGLGTETMMIDVLAGRVGIGTTTPVFKLSLDNDGGILAKGTLGSGATYTTFIGPRLLWYPRLAAFRAGYAAAGDDNTIGDRSIALGWGAEASAEASVAFGMGKARGYESTAMGFDSVASGSISTVMGKNNIASGDYSTAMGGSPTGGEQTIASGTSSTAMGYATSATNEAATAMGKYTTASGAYSTAMGQDTIANRQASIAMGYGTLASGPMSTATGFNTTASGDNSIAMGQGTTASGFSSTAMGDQTTASGTYTTAMGKRTTTQALASVVLGQDNVSLGGNPTSWVSTDPLFVIGNGANAGSPSNALTVLKNGDTAVGGILDASKGIIVETRTQAQGAPPGAVPGRLWLCTDCP